MSDSDTSIDVDAPLSEAVSDALGAEVSRALERLFAARAVVPTRWSVEAELPVGVTSATLLLGEVPLGHVVTLTRVLVSTSAAATVTIRNGAGALVAQVASTATPAEIIGGAPVRFGPGERVHVSYAGVAGDTIAVVAWADLSPY